MLTLALLRHAKSSWDTPGLDDFERPLNARGQQAAPVMGREIRRLKLDTGSILCSPAARTRETLALALPGRSSGPAVAYERDLYMATAEDLLGRLRRLSDDHPSALVIGHNPSLHNLALALAGKGDRDAMADLAHDFPTATLAVIEFDLSRWRDIDVGKGRLVHYTTPRRLSPA